MSLRKALPHAIGTPPGQRHEFQEKVLDAAGQFLADAHAACSADLAGKEKAVGDEGKELTELHNAFAEAKLREAEKQTTMQAKEAVHAATTMAVKDSADAVEAAKKSVKDFEDSQQPVRHTLLEFEAA